MKATPINPSPKSTWTPPKPTPPLSAQWPHMKTKSGEPLLAQSNPTATKELHRLARERRAQVVKLSDRGTPRSEIAERLGIKPWCATYHMRGLPKGQDRNRATSIRLLMDSGHTAEELRGLCRRWKHGEVWAIVRPLLDYRNEDGEPLSVGCVADACGLRWRYVLRLMAMHDYDRGIVEDQR